MRGYEAVFQFEGFRYIIGFGSIAVIDRREASWARN
jgi:hypothetical protein